MQTSEKYQRRHRCHHICHRATGHSLHMSQIDSDFRVIRLGLFYKIVNGDLPLRYGVISHMNIFFTCKNSLVILLQMYRLLVLILKKRPQYR